MAPWLRTRVPELPSFDTEAFEGKKASYSSQHLLFNELLIVCWLIVRYVVYGYMVGLIFIPTIFAALEAK